MVTAAYRAFANGRGGPIELAGCWAHVRRKFYEALEQSPRTSGWLLRQIQHLYRVEAQTCGNSSRPPIAPSGARQSKPAARGTHPTRVGSAQEQRTTSAAELAGQAIDYALGQWRRWMFIWRTAGWRSTTTWWKTPSGPRPSARRTGSSSAMPMPANAAPSFTPSLKVAGGAASIPYAYLRDVLTRLPNMTNWQIPEVTPEAWAKTHLPCNGKRHHKRRSIISLTLTISCRCSVNRSLV